MPNEITITVKGDNRSEPAFKQSQDDLDKLKVKAKATGIDLDGLSREFERAARQTDDFGHKLQGTGSFTEFLQHKIGGLREETHRLADEFNRSGDLDLGRKLFANQNAIGELEKLSKRITSDLATAVEDGGREGFKNLSAQVQGAESTPGLGPAVTAGIVTAAAAAAPGVLAALNGALLAGAGLGGIGLGVIGQLESPGVQAAAKKAGHDIMDELAADTRPFREPLETAIDTLAGDAKIAIGSIDFGALADDVQPLASALGGLITNIMPGFNKALEAAQPILTELDADLPRLGDAVSGMFDDFAKGEQGAGEGLRVLMILLAGAINIIGKAVLVGSTLTDWYVRAGEASNEFASKLLGWIPGAHKAFDSMHHMFEVVHDGPPALELLGRSLVDMGSAASLSADDLDTLNKKVEEVTDATSALAARWVDKLFSEMMGVDQATLRWHESLTSLADTLSKNGLAIDRHTHQVADNTKAGEQNRAAILGAVQANEQQYQAMVAGGISAIDAAKAYDANTASLEKQLRQAGYTKAEIDDLIGKYRQVPDKVNTALAVSGLTDAINNLGALEAQIHNIDGRKFGFYITEHHAVDYQDYRAGERSGKASGGIMGAASGGMRDGLTWVGEYGRELVRLPSGSQVYPHGTSENMAAASGRGGDGARADVVMLRADDALMAAFVRQVQQYVRGAGGDGATLGIVRVSG